MLISQPRLFGLVQLVLTTCLTLAAARGVNLFIAASLHREAPAPPRQLSMRRASVQGPPQALLDSARLARVLGLRVVEAPPSPPTSAGEDPDTPVRSALPARLLGTLVATHEEWSLASLQAEPTSRAMTYMMGDAFADGTVVGITHRRVLLQRGGRLEFIEVKDPSGESGPGGGLLTRSSTPPLPSQAGAHGIHATGEDTFDISREVLDSAVDNLATLSTQARVGPAFKNGEMVGFRLLHVQSGSLFAQLGVKPGDVITGVNGRPLKRVEDVLEMFGRLRNTARIDLEVQRNGGPLRMTYNIR